MDSGVYPLPSHSMNRSPHSQTTFSLVQAVDAAPALAALQERIRDSNRFLCLVRHLLPGTLQQQVKAGPIQEGEWCLLVNNTAASTKLRQMLPAIQRELTQNGAQVSAIRIKVQVVPR
jgi:hypothetical protein